MNHRHGPIVNETFRQWTRGVSFTLTMGKTQVATLVALHYSQRLPNHIGERHKLLRNFVGAAKGLEERGLLVYHPWHSVEEHAKRRAKGEYRLYYEVTVAGEHVCALLQAAGVYQELVAEFLKLDRRDARASA